MMIMIFSLPHCTVHGRDAKLVPGSDVKPRAQRAARLPERCFCATCWGRLALRTVAWPHVPAQEPSSLPIGGPKQDSPCGTLQASDGAPWSTSITGILGVFRLAPAPPGARGGSWTCVPCRRAPESKTLPFALSSFTGHGEFFIFSLAL